jgi:hypothetical protein
MSNKIIRRRKGETKVVARSAAQIAVENERRAEIRDSLREFAVMPIARPGSGQGSISGMGVRKTR